MVRRGAPNDDQLRAIGNVTLQFSLLEYTVISLIHELLDEKGRVKHMITANLSFGRLIELLGNLGPFKRPDLGQRFKALVLHAKAAQEKRDQITHSVWNGGLKPNTLLRMKRVMNTKVPEPILKLWGWKIQEIDTDGIEAVAGFIAEVQFEAFELEWKYVKGLRKQD